MMVEEEKIEEKIQDLMRRVGVHLAGVDAQTVHLEWDESATACGETAPPSRWVRWRGDPDAMRPWFVKCGKCFGEKGP